MVKLMVNTTVKDQNHELCVFENDNYGKAYGYYNG